MLGYKRRLRIYSTVIFQNKADLLTSAAAQSHSVSLLNVESLPPSDPVVVINKATET